MDLPKTFAIYLKTQGISRVTVKNYLSDLNHFLAWMELTLRTTGKSFSLDEPKYFSPYFTRGLVEKYKSYLVANALPSSTINRRLSTLRTFAKFCLSRAWITENPTREINNLSGQSAFAPSAPLRASADWQNGRVLQEFKAYLETQNNSSNTIKSYLSDIREFLTWMGAAT